jgi:hypothetical protein
MKLVPEKKSIFKRKTIFISMKTKLNTIGILFILAILPFGNYSCKSVKSAVACPDISIKKNEFAAHNKARHKNSLTARNSNQKSQSIKHSRKNPKEERLNNASLPAVRKDYPINKIDYNIGLLASSDNTFYPAVSKPAVFSKPDYDSTKNSTDIVASTLQQIKCDTIYLKSGGFAIGKVEEIGQGEIKYRRCNNLTGPVISLLKSNVSRIVYSNGTSDLFGPTEMPAPGQYYPANQSIPSQNNPEIPKIEGLGLAGFITGLVGLFVASIPLGVIAVVLGAVSLSRIKKYPQRYKGKGFAIASMILGIVDIVAMVVLLGAA